MPLVFGTHRAEQEREMRGYRWITPAVFGVAPIIGPLQSALAQTTQEWPVDRGGYKQFTLGPVAYGFVQSVTPEQGTQVKTVQEIPDHPNPRTSGPIAYGAAQAAQTLQSAQIKTVQEIPDHPFPRTAGPVAYGIVQSIRPLQGTAVKIVQEWPLDRWGYKQLAAGPAAYGFVQSITPIQAAYAKTVQEWPFVGAGFILVSGPASYVAAPTATPAQTVKTIQEQPAHPFPWTLGAVAYGASQASRPLQSAQVRTVEEWPRDWTGYRFVLGPVAYGAAQAAIPLQGIKVNIVQEQPGHPSPWTSGPVAYGVAPSIRPLQGTKANTTQELPWHPGPWTLGSFFVPVVTTSFVLQPQISIGQEWPRDWTGYRSILGPVAYGAAQRSRPLQSAQVKTTQETPFHPGAWTQGPVAYGAAQAIRPLQFLQVKTTEEWPRDWTGYRFVLGAAAYGAVQARTPLQSIKINVTQETPWHPNSWTLGSFFVRPPAASFVLQPQISVLQEFPSWHPLPWTTLRTLYVPPPAPLPPTLFVGGELTAPRFVLDLASILPPGLLLLAVESHDNKVTLLDVCLSPASGMMQALAGEIQVNKYQIPTFFKFFCLASTGQTVIVNAAWVGKWLAFL